jgi:short-subunit dehydrogenase
MNTMVPFGEGTTLLIGISPELAEAGRILGETGERIGLMSRDAARLEEYLRWYRDHGVDSAHFPVDVTEPESVLSAFTAVAHWSHRIDRLIYNVNVASSEAAVNLTPSELHRVMQSNFFGFVNCLQLAIPVFRHYQGGTALIISAQAHLPTEEDFGVANSASRSSLQIYNNALRKELAGTNVSVCELAVGWKSDGTGWCPLDTADVADGILYCLRERPHRHQIGITQLGLSDF